MALATAENLEALKTKYVGRFAKSIETGWLGKIVAVENTTCGDGDVMLKMHGVDSLYRVLQGGDIEDAVDSSDVQWFVPADVRLVKLV